MRTNKLSNDTSDAHIIGRVLSMTDNIPKFIIDVGASEGHYNSNSMPLILEMSWCGILLEPMPIQFKQLMTRYQDIDDIQCINAVLCDNDSIVDMFIHPNDGDGTTAGNHGSSLIKMARNKIVVKVPSISYESLNSLRNLRDVGILSIDTEGYDFDILRGLLPLGLPAVIISEVIEVGEEDKVRFIESFGYHMIIDGHSNKAWALPHYIREN
jgi:FkbM family methyltransferase